MTFTLRTSGLRRNPFRRFDWAVAATQWADRMQPLAEAALRAEAPVGNGPGAGALRDSIRAERVIGRSTVTLTFTAHVPYASYVLDGTAAHLIRPRNAQALHWTGADGDHFATVVHHPGTSPNDFPRRALEPLSPAIKAVLTAALNQQLTE